MIELSFDTIIVAALDKELPLSLPPSSVNLIKKAFKGQSSHLLHVCLYREYGGHAPRENCES